MISWLQRLVSLVLVLVVLAGIQAPPAQACSRGPTTQEADYLAANAIFSATVLRLEDVYPSQTLAVLQPLDVYKGKASSYVVTNDDSDQCGASLEAGKTYLFFAQGWDIPYISVFDAYEDGTEHMKALVQWLEARAEEPSGYKAVEAFRQGEIRLTLEQQDQGKMDQAFISNHTVYAPLPYILEVLGSIPASARERLQAETIAYGKERFVPVRLAAESMGYEVGWIEHNSMVVIHTPIDKRKGPMTLAMRYLIQVGLEGSLEVDRLTKDEIAYRSYHGHMPPGLEVQPQTHPFSDMLQEEIGHRKYILEFYMKNGQNDIRLLAAPELVHRIESDSAFRAQVGKRLGKPAGALPAHRLVTAADFE
ncbi:hypothetical protein [Bacillus sp. 3255]|uniref:hypothetical protein n=1 Tax=Bacillus sp. 3255 TaxID=2817904 RepID=UPI00285B4855|nr:hypothetical protein [Bacillus sp. 3255]MDR6878264.1 hypothetical protein [Bacillus sp. 3255]